MISNLLIENFDVDSIVTHAFDEAGSPLPNGPLIVVDLSGNVVRGI